MSEDALHDCNEVSRRSLERLRPFIEQISSGRFVALENGALAAVLQQQYGDVILKMPNGSLATLECKAEEDKSPNIFFEVYSNLVGSVRNHYSIPNKAGWGYTSQATFLLYHFLEDDTLLIGDMLRIKRWAFGHWSDGKWVAGQLFRMDEDRRGPQFIERPQGKRLQLNNTVGRLVPWRLLIKECRMTQHRVGQGELFPVDFPVAA